MKPAQLERRKREHWLLGVTIAQEHDYREVSRSKGFRRHASQPSKAGLNPSLAQILTTTSFRADFLHVPL